MRLADLNRDGLTDVVWSAFGQQGVLLNTGGEVSGSASSAWCASEAGDVGQVDGNACPEAGVYKPPRPFVEPSPSALPDTTGMLADFNGDGFLDFVRVTQWQPDAATNSFSDVWIYSPAATSSHWVLDARFDFTVDWNAEVIRPYYGSTVSGWQDGVMPRFRAFDIDGDGSDDLIGDTNAFLSQAHHSDLIRTVDNGRGGSFAIEYASMIKQRDAALEEQAVAGNVPWGDAAVPVPLWRSSAVVAQLTRSGFNLAAPGEVTTYRYAHPRFHRELRSDLGFGLVVRTMSGGTAIEDSFYQDPGRTGRLAQRLILDDESVVHRTEATWQHVAGMIPGRGPDTYLARLVEEWSANEYGGDSGAAEAQSYLYDDDYGFNFVTQLRVTRASTDTVRFRLPETADTTAWIVGLPREVLEGDQRGSGWLSRSEFTYLKGRVATETRHRNRLDTSSPAADLTQYFYDGFGNLRQRIDANNHLTEFEYDPSGTVLLSRTDPALSASDPGKITIFTPHAVFGIPVGIDPGYRDIPPTTLVLDAFGRVKETWKTPRDQNGVGSPVVVSATFYSDGTSPPYVDRVDYTNEALDGIRTAVVDDGFGGVWKTIRDAGPTATGDMRFMGSATYHWPANRLSRTTYDLPCTQGTAGQPDSLCGGITGAGETPAAVTTSDALGRPILVSTPRGTSRYHYTAANEQIAEGSWRAFHDVDVVWSQNAKGDLTRSSFDGERVVAVEECTNSNAARTDLAGAGCANANGAHRTLYAYHASGQLEFIHDPVGVATSFGTANHTLRYSFDTAGNVIAIDDPDAGHSETYYDGVGNVTTTLNARLQSRTTAYDALDRPTLLTTPEDNVSFGYRPEELQLQVEYGPGYSKDRSYDGFGRLRYASIRGGFSKGFDSASYAYDLQGQPTTISATGVLIQYEYAGAFLQRVCAVTTDVPCSDPSRPDPSRQLIVTSVAYDDLGRRETMVTPAGTRKFTYRDSQDRDDPRDLVQDQFLGATTLTYGYSAHDALGNVRSWSVTGVGASAGNASGTYAYDARNRLSGWTREADGQDDRNETFGYDPLGNLTQHGAQPQTFNDPDRPHALKSRGSKTYDHDGSGNLARAGNRYYTFDSADRLIKVGTSAGGSDVLKVAYDAAGDRVLEWWGANRIRRYLGPDQVYDGSEWRLDILAFGERIAYTVKQRSPATASLEGFALDVPPWLLALPPAVVLAWCLGLAIRGGLLVGVARRPGYASLSGVLIVSLVLPYPSVAGGGGGAVRIYRWVVSDRLGSGMAVFDSGGVLLHQTRYTPFGSVDGEHVGAPDSSSYRRSYAGHYEQAETGLVYMNARWMDPETGTFLSVDPVVANYADPQSYNAYAYARNNPVNMTDPTGMCPAAMFSGSCFDSFTFSADGGGGGPGKGGPTDGLACTEGGGIPCNDFGMDLVDAVDKATKDASKVTPPPPPGPTPGGDGGGGGGSSPGSGPPSVEGETGVTAMAGFLSFAGGGSQSNESPPTILETILPNTLGGPGELSPEELQKFYQPELNKIARELNDLRQKILFRRAQLATIDEKLGSRKEWKGELLAEGSKFGAKFTAALLWERSAIRGDVDNMLGREQALLRRQSTIESILRSSQQ